MPRVHPSSERSTYWWTEEIANLRRSSVHARRALDRALKSRSSPHRAARIKVVAEEYKAVRDALRCAISKEKARAWGELVLALDKDPWGRPYKIVLNKLKGGTTPMTETLDPQFVHRIVATLFPAEEGADPIPAPESGPEWEDELGVTQRELKDAVRRIKSRKAPGPDGVHGKVWALASKEIAEYMRHLLSRCLKDGCFPSEWKRAKFVLIPKGANRGTHPPLIAPSACWMRRARS